MTAVSGKLQAGQILWLAIYHMCALWLTAVAGHARKRRKALKDELAAAQAKNKDTKGALTVSAN